MRARSTLDWSQSKIFLVLVLFLSVLLILYCLILIPFITRVFRNIFFNFHALTHSRSV